METIFRVVMWHAFSVLFRVASRRRRRPGRRAVACNFVVCSRILANDVKRAASALSSTHCPLPLHIQPRLFSESATIKGDRLQNNTVADAIAGWQRCCRLLQTSAVSERRGGGWRLPFIPTTTSGATPTEPRRNGEGHDEDGDGLNDTKGDAIDEALAGFREGVTGAGGAANGADAEEDGEEADGQAGGPAGRVAGLAIDYQHENEAVDGLGHGHTGENGQLEGRHFTLEVTFFRRRWLKGGDAGRRSSRARQPMAQNALICCNAICVDVHDVVLLDGVVGWV